MGICEIVSGRFVTATLICAVCAAAPLYAQAAKPDLLAFSIGPVVAVEDTRQSFFTFISYTPRFALREDLYARPNLGFTMLRNSVNELFPVFEAQALLGYFISKNLGAELGAGVQYLSEYARGFPALTVNFIYRPDSRILLIDRFLFGYTPVFLDGAAMHQARIAAGVTF